MLLLLDEHEQCHYTIEEMGCQKSGRSFLHFNKKVIDKILSTCDNEIRDCWQKHNIFYILYRGGIQHESNDLYWKRMPSERI